jgi:electron transport complex protein RnfC
MYSKLIPHLFRGGVHPADGKAISCSEPIKTAPLLDKYIVPLHQNIGAPPKLIVTKGQTVKKGEMIAEPGGFVSVPVHAPTSGTVGELVDIPGVAGNVLQAV